MARSLPHCAVSILTTRLECSDIQILPLLCHSSQPSRQCMSLGQWCEVSMVTFDCKGGSVCQAHSPGQTDRQPAPLRWTDAHSRSRSLSRTDAQTHAHSQRQTHTHNHAQSQRLAHTVRQSDAHTHTHKEEERGAYRGREGGREKRRKSEKERERAPNYIHREIDR